MDKLIKLILLFVCEMIVVVSAFLIEDKILDYRHEKKIQEAQRKELYHYRDLLIYCSDELTFSKVYEIDKYINDICLIYEKNKDLFEEVKSMIPYYVKAAKAVESIKNKCHNTAMRINDYMELKEYNDMRDIVDHSDIGSGYLRNRLLPLVGISDEDHRLFVELIISDKNILELESINFQSVNSFEDILDLYRENRDDIKRINQHQQYVDLYYQLMRECREELTFAKVDEIFKWVEENEKDSLIKGNDKFKTIKKYIPHYKAAADAIRGIKDKIANGCLYFINYMELDEIDILNTTRWNALIKGGDFAKEMRKSCQIMTAFAKYYKDKIIYTDAEYELFINLILADIDYDGLSKINFKEVNSFYDVNKLYNDNRVRIRKEIY